MTATAYVGTEAPAAIEGEEYEAAITVPLPDPITTSPPPNGYEGSINWGDNYNVTETATPQYNEDTGTLGAVIEVTGTHHYLSAGPNGPVTYGVVAMVQNPVTQQTSTAEISVPVLDAPLSPLPQSLTTWAGNTGSLVVGQFEDANPFGTAGQFQAGVKIGSAAAVPGTVSGSVGMFSVSVADSGLGAGVYPVTVMVKDVDGSETTIDSTLTVLAPWSVVGTAGSRSDDPGRAYVWLIRKVLQHNIERRCLSANWGCVTYWRVCSGSSP